MFVQPFVVFTEKKDVTHQSSNLAADLHAGAGSEIAVAYEQFGQQRAKHGDG